jgi:hypothetical protein
MRDLCICDHPQSEHFPDPAEREGLGGCQHEDDGCECEGFESASEPDADHWRDDRRDARVDGRGSRNG